MRKGDIATGWNKNNRSTLGIDAGLTWQMGDHEIRTGFDRKNYSYRKYSISTSAIRDISRNSALLAYGESPVFDGTNEDITDDLAQFNRNGQIGYDDYGNEIDDEGLKGPRSPWTQSFYVNDKYEAGDVVVSAGIRIDQFNLDDSRLKDKANPPWDESQQGVDDDGILESETKTEIQPRIGLAFPVSDEVVFHLQYGKYAQMPELDLPYASPRYMHLVWGGQYYTPDPMGFDLDPVLTPERYQTQFAKFIEEGIEGDGLEEMYENAHKAIREDPTFKPTEKEASYPKVNDQPRRTYEERKAAVQAKKDAMRAALEAADDDEDDDDDDDE
jgi:hypothetical protein